MAWFFEFNENTTVKQVREKFSNEEYCENFISTHVKTCKRGEKGAIDTVAAFILGGYHHKNYEKSQFGSSSTWSSVVANFVGLDRNDMTEVSTELSQLIKPNDDLKAADDKMDSWGRWKNLDKKKQALDILKNSNPVTNQNGGNGNNMTKMKKM